MAKQVVGVKHRREGTVERLYKVIKCLECGAITYERKAKKVEQALQRKCKACPTAKHTQDHSRVVDSRTAHPLYPTYMGMLERCYNENWKQYDDYGGRGIRVCVRWLVDFWAFVEDMGEKPSPEHSIDRIDNDGPYDPRNIRWATPKEQMNNRRPYNSLLTDEEWKEQKRLVLKLWRSRNYQRRPLGWWRENFGLYNNPYIYGPMPYKQTSASRRKREAIDRGWFIPYKK